MDSIYFNTIRERIAKHVNSFSDPASYPSPSGPRELHDALRKIQELILAGRLVENPQNPVNWCDCAEFPD